MLITFTWKEATRRLKCEIFEHETGEEWAMFALDLADETTVGRCCEVVIGMLRPHLREAVARAIVDDAFPPGPSGDGPTPRSSNVT